MRTPTLILASLLSSSLALGCGGGGEKKDDSKDTKADAKKADDKAGGDEKAADDGAGGDEAAGGEVALPKTGLKGTAPAGANVSEMMGNDMVQAPGLVVTVEPGDDKPKTGEDAQKDADMYTPKDPKIETLEDGYVLTFTNEGGMGTNFFVNARREIDGKAYWCSTTASDQAQSDNAVAFCKSLKK